LLKTAGRWPWKSESAKECVTTHLPKQLALKMDGAKAPHSYPTVAAEQTLFCGPHAATSRKVAGVARKALGVNLAGAAPGADLGGSSKYSREALEDRRGEGFRVNSRWTRVSRS
jgi:hypothetical protein